MFSNKFFYCFCSVLMIILLFFQPCFVFASEINRPQQTEGENDNAYVNVAWENLINRLMFEVGVSADFSSALWNDTVTYVKSYLEGKNYFDNGDGTVKCLTDSSGNIIITADMLLELRNLIEQNMKSKEPYSIYYPSGYPTAYYDNSSAAKYILPSNSELYLKSRVFYDGFRAVGFSNYRYSLIDNKKFKYAYKSGGYIRLVDNDLNASSAVLILYVRGEGKVSDVMPDYNLPEYSFDNLVSYLGENNVTWSDGYEKLKTGTKSDGTLTYSCYHSGVTNNFYGQPLQVFNSLADLYDYVSSKPTAYYTSEYYNKTYQDITLNQETIKNYTTENVQNIYNTINNNAGDALTADELQKIIDDTVSSELDKINGSLDDVNDNLKGVNAALEKILKSLDKSGEELKTQTSWLEKIYKVLKHMDETLLVISSDLDEILEDDGLFDQQTSISSLTAVLNIFLYGVPEPEEEPAPSSVYYDDSSGEYVEEPVVLSARYASRSGGGVVGLMFDKFPFCVPWDVYYCFLSLAETPEAPHFTFPFVIDSMGFRYEFNFNLSRFSMLSELCRMFLTLTFVVYMTHLTKKIVGGK